MRLSFFFLGKEKTRRQFPFVQKKKKKKKQVFFFFFFLFPCFSQTYLFFCVFLF